MKAKYFPILLLIQILNFQNVIAQTVYYDNTTKLYGIIDRSGKNILKPTFDEIKGAYHPVQALGFNIHRGL